ncbi:hypothetical protein CYY_001940 [Polysphondylium violaceum]|uniref:Double-strand break repair protein n=1 Tax=Polysphondylium violaceum TaxID=133409 RepID=A0A8J4Q8I6_9MYCE|nr:hypothetical protein CYY_001940 [Polysphondylium violaceum]
MSSPPIDTDLIDRLNDDSSNKDDVNNNNNHNNSNNNNNNQDDAKANIMRILVATDNHLGYLEKDPIRGDDSFNSFEEILNYAVQLKVDMVLLGGDLFHDNKPSRTTMYRTMELLRKYCLGEKRVGISFLSDQSVNFTNQFHVVNYEDPNFNISLPVFSIHGNHDDPTGEGGLAALDLLSVSNLVNYFGKIDDIDDINVYPLLLSKGETKIAIYGLGNVRDERLHRTFQKQNVKLMRPNEAKEEWFNILVLHQNRIAHNPKNYVHEKMIDGFIDFVLWGHEHECLIKPQPSSIGEFHITQPGSSVATALSEGESKDKFVGLLEVHKSQFRFKPFPLQTVRPFIIDAIALSDSGIDATQQNLVNEYLDSKIEEMINQAKEKTKGKLNESMLPLIRLKVDYTGYSTLNPQRFGSKYAGRVANPADILLFHRKKPTSVPKSSDPFEKDKAPVQDKIKVDDFISEFLGNTKQDRLSILSEADLHQALYNFVEKDEIDSLTKLVDLSLTNSQRVLKTNIPLSNLNPDFISNQVQVHFPFRSGFETNSGSNGSDNNNNNNVTMHDPNEFEARSDEEDSHAHDHHGHGHSHGNYDQDSDSDVLDIPNLMTSPTHTTTTTTSTSRSTPTPTTPVSKGTRKKSSSTPATPSTPIAKTPRKRSAKTPPATKSQDIISIDSNDEDDEDVSTPTNSKKRGKAKQATPTTRKRTKKTKNSDDDDSD